MIFKISIIATLLIAILQFEVSWAGDYIAHLQHNQSKRISKGIQRGEITDSELRRLNREQERIRRTINRALADGRLMSYEERRIHSLLDRAGKNIHQSRHNNLRERRHKTYSRHVYKQRRHPRFQYKGHRAPRPHGYGSGFHIFWKWK